MRLLFLGTCTFGDASSSPVLNPFENISDCLHIGDIVFLNMNGIISPRKLYSNEKFNSSGKQLLSLKKLIPHIPIVVTFKNDNLARGDEGVKDTERFLKKNGFIFSADVLKPILYNNLCIFDFTTVDLLVDSSIMKHTIPLHITATLDKLLLDIISGYVKPIRKIIIIIKTHVRTNVHRLLFDCISEKMIDAGASVVFGYGNHNLVKNNYKKYKKGLIITSLGDLVNCNMNREKCYENKTEICLYNTLSKRYDTLEIKRIIFEECLLPDN